MYLSTGFNANSRARKSGPTFACHDANSASMSFSSVGMSGPAGVTRGGRGKEIIEEGEETIEEGMEEGVGSRRVISVM